MNAVGIVTIVLGLIVVCSRGALVVAPAAALRRFDRLIETNGRTRALGVFALTLGAAMVWAGASEYSGLATFLSVGGWVIVAISALMLVMFPNLYRAVAEAILPSDPDTELMGWRIVGLAGVSIGGLLIYLGALAL